MRWFLGRLLAHFDVEESVLLALGADDHGGERFNMTTLALRGRRFHNGVSKIHGDVASPMAGYLWPQVTTAANPIQNVPNRVPPPTFITRAWTSLLLGPTSRWDRGCHAVWISVAHVTLKNKK